MATKLAGFEGPRRGTLRVEVPWTLQEVESFFTEKHQSLEEFGLKMETFSCGHRCQGFTLAYGVFLPDYKAKVSNDDDSDDVDVKTILEECNEGDTSRFTLSRLPCCWPRETGYGWFLGYNAYPLIWSQSRYFWKADDGRASLIDVEDGAFVRRETKNELLEAVKDRRPYKLPDPIQSAAVHIHKAYCEVPTWKDCLYVAQYPGLRGWTEILDRVYGAETERTREGLEERVDDCMKTYGLFDEMLELVPRWSFIPSDCASCS